MSTKVYLERRHEGESESYGCILSGVVINTTPGPASLARAIPVFAAAPWVRNPQEPTGKIVFSEGRFVDGFRYGITWHNAGDPYQTMLEAADVASLRAELLILANIEASDDAQVAAKAAQAAVAKLEEQAQLARLRWTSTKKIHRSNQ